MFVISTGGDLFELVMRSYKRLRWFYHGRPDGQAIAGGPGAVIGNSLFVTAADGRLFERVLGTSLELLEHLIDRHKVDRNGVMSLESGVDGSEWIEHGRPPGTSAVTTPDGIIDSSFFVGGRNGHLFQRGLIGTEWGWVDHGRPGAGVASKPGAVIADTSVFVTNRDGLLYERHRDGRGWSWLEHPLPTPTSRCMTCPATVVGDGRVFVGMSRGVLWERAWNGSEWEWAGRGHPRGTVITTAPAGPGRGESVFVGTKNDRLFEGSLQEEWVWTDHGTPTEDRAVFVIDNRAPLRQKQTLVVVGDGFAEADLPAYEAWVDRELVHGVFDRDLFASTRSAFNVVRVDLVSVDSGVSVKTYDEGGTPYDASDDVVVSETHHETRLGMIYSGSWAHCWLEGTPGTAEALWKVLDRFAPDWDLVLIVLNHPGYGGCGGAPYQWVTLGGGWSVIAHELGHGAFGLCDEYFHEGDYTGTYSFCPNCCAAEELPKLKWADLVDPATPIPTAVSGVPVGQENTLVGAFEGCSYCSKGIYRPVVLCRMRWNIPPFCPVCDRHARKVLEPYL